MDKIKISVIIPVYNVEKYLQDCVNSVLLQTYSDLQIILVDDGSTDKSGEICDDYKNKDDRIEVVHKENGGLSDARNVGLTFADGDFIFYLDSDDYLEKDAFEKMLNIQQSLNADIIVGNYYYTYSDREEIEKCQFEEQSLDNYCAMEALVTGKIKNFAWGKLIKTKIAKSCEFPKDKLFEDVYWTHLIFAKADCVVVVDEPILHYRQRNDSISYEYTIKRLDILDGWMERKNFLEQYYPDLVNAFLQNIAKNYLNVAWLVLRKMKTQKTRAFQQLRRFNKELRLQNYALGTDKKMIKKLDKSILLYTIYAIVCRFK